MKMLTSFNELCRYLCFEKIIKIQIIMKKRNFKLGLNKRNISNLTSIRGGNGPVGPQTISCTCPFIETTDETQPGHCPDTNTQLTTCHGETKSRTCTVETHCLC